jgi:hypothetical protein
VYPSAVNCGDCGIVCGTGKLCVAVGGGHYTCTLLCPSGQASCGELCTDTRLDKRNCGYCGHICETTQVCKDGICVLP